MASGPGGPTTIIGGRRVKLVAINGTTSTVGSATTTTTAAMNVVGSNGNVLNTARSTTRQKVRRVLGKDARWQDNNPRDRLKCSAASDYCAVNNFSIVASKGELSRNNYVSCETPTPSVVVTTNGKKGGSPLIANGKLRTNKEKYSTRNFIFGKDSSRKSSANDGAIKHTIAKLENLTAKSPRNKCSAVLTNLRKDRVRTCENQATKLPPSWESPSGDPAALLRAAKEADDALLKEIVNSVRQSGTKKMDVNIADGSGRSAISYMAGNGTSTMLERALSFEGANPNLPDNEGNTPLHFAAQAGQTECLNILLQKCPDIEVDARNTLGFTPLMKAALQGRTRCAKILLFAGANPTLRDYGRGLRADQWARFCGRYICAEVIERFARQRLLERTTSCRWGSEPELAAKVLQGKVIPIPTNPVQPPSTGLKSRIRRVFRTTSGPDRNFSLVTQLTSAALCASSPALPKPGDVPPVVKSLLRPLCVPQLRVTLVAPQEIIEKTADKYGTNFNNDVENSIVKPPRTKKKTK